jgi:hypothetical protein
VKKINAEKRDGIYIQPAGSPVTPNQQLDDDNEDTPLPVRTKPLPVKRA